jgi:phytoene dehydrogenase-like protein
MPSPYDAVIVGAGPNGLTAAALLSGAGLKVLVLEARATVGGSCATYQLTLPGFSHDLCAAIHPMAMVSPIFRRLRLNRFGLRWAAAPVALAHPFDDGRVALLGRGFDATSETLGGDGPTWLGSMRPFTDHHEDLFDDILRPVRVPSSPWLMARFGLLGLQAASRFVRRFRDVPARALFAGCAAHSFLAMDAAGSASFGLALAITGHVVDWPCAVGGSHQIANALTALARSRGCEVRLSSPVRSLAGIPHARAILLDVTPRQLLAIAGDELSATYRKRLERFRYGPGAFKIDYALSEPIPWRSAACAKAATIHLGGTFEEIAHSESDATTGRVTEAPFVLLAQQSLFDKSRAPEGRHTGWAYCHVPHGCTVDMTERIERQIERFAPGFRDIVLARHVSSPASLEDYNPNLVGGDITGGANTLGQVIARPFPQWNPYATSNPRLFLCSSSTPPGGGVHGMCGYWAAHTVLRRVFKREMPALDV